MKLRTFFFCLCFSHLVFSFKAIGEDTFKAEWVKSKMDQIKSAKQPESELEIVQQGQNEMHRDLKQLREGISALEKSIEEESKASYKKSGVFLVASLHQGKTYRTELKKAKGNLKTLQEAWRNGQYLANYREKLRKQLDPREQEKQISDKIMQLRLNKEFYQLLNSGSVVIPEVTRRFDQLENETLTQEQMLLALELAYNQTIMGRFVQRKMERVLGSGEFCQSVKECPTPSNRDLSSLFSDGESRSKPTESHK